MTAFGGEVLRVLKIFEFQTTKTLWSLWFEENRNYSTTFSPNFTMFDLVNCFIAMKAYFLTFLRQLL